MNNRERELWIDNDEGLYNWFCDSRQSKRAFIRENREELDKCIRSALGEPEPITRYENTSRPMF